MGELIEHMQICRTFNWLFRSNGNVYIVGGYGGLSTDDSMNWIMLLLLLLLSTLQQHWIDNYIIAENYLSFAFVVRYLVDFVRTYEMRKYLDILFDWKSKHYLL